MRKIVETTEECGFDALLGETVLLLCANYFYVGVLVGVNDTFVELKDPSIVYETGDWADAKYKDVQRLHTPSLCVQRAFIEAFGRGK